MGFVNTHTHSHYSIFDSISKIKDIVSRAKELEQDAVALTDHGTVTGLMDFYKECKKQKIKPILGCELYWTPHLSIKDRNLQYHLCVYAKNYEGYKSLLEVVTESYEHMYYKPRVSTEMLMKLKGNVIVTSACMGGILSHDMENAVVFKEIFGNDFYIELHANMMEEQKEYNLVVAELAKKLDIPVVAAVDAHYIRKEDAPTHRAWKKIGEDDERGYYLTDDFYLKSEAEVFRVLRSHKLPLKVITEAVRNTVAIADQCKVEISFGQNHYPEFPVDDKISKIKEICEQGWQEKISGRVENEEEYKQRYETELDMLARMDYLNYFLLTWDVLRYCDTAGIMRGPGRGSVGGSLVAYLMGITAIDPVKYNLVFERFAHLERVTSPDIDNDIQSSRRQDVIDYIKNKYGYVYQVRTINYVGIKAAIQRAGQALKITPAEVDNYSKNFGTEETFPMLPHKELKELAQNFIGLIQNYGCHTSAIVVFPSDPTQWCAIEKQSDYFIAGSDYHFLEDQGLLKLDILGLKELDIIAETLKNIPDTIDINNLPIDDKKTVELLQQGRTLGIFQLESQGMTELVKNLKPTGYTDIAPLVALYRPGPLDSGMVDVYLSRRNGEKIHYLHPKLEKILQDTQGIILYQEQILEIARDLCGYTLGQADILRRIIGRKEVEKMAPAISDFINKGMENGIPEDTIKTISEQVITFALYGFNKAHSFEYGYIAWITAYLKAHYPRQFITAMLNGELGKSAKDNKSEEYVKEARRLGIRILPPSIKYSKPNWSIELDGIRVGLRCIKGIGNTFIDVPEHAGIGGLIQLHKVNKTALTNLVKAGAFEGDKGFLLAAVEWVKEHLPRIYECLGKYNDLMFFPSRQELWLEKLKQVPPLHKVTPIPYENTNLEREVLGFIINDELPLYDFRLVDNIEIFGGECVAIKPHQTKAGKPMAFIKLRTKSGIKDFVWFDGAYKEMVIGEIYLVRCWSGNKIKDIAKAKKLG